MAPKKKWGGKRKNAGRRPVEDKKQTVSVYIPTSIIEKVGGLERIKLIIYKYFKI